MYKLITTVPEKDADRVREVLAKAGAGKIGNYSHCSFSVKGTGRFKAKEGANPTIGEVGKNEEVIEERIEVNVEDDTLENVISALKVAHPYEEPIIDIYKLNNISSNS